MGSFYVLFTERDDLGPEQFMAPTDQDWISNNLCLCGSVKPTRENQVLDLQYSRCPKHTLHDAFGAICLSRELFTVLSQSDPLFRPKVGRVYDKNGIECKDYASIFDPSSRSITLRGGLGAKYRRCKLCGFTWMSDPGNTGQAMAIEYFVRSRHVLLFGGRSDIIVSEQVAEKISTIKTLYMTTGKIKVVSSPCDGYMLPGDPDWATLDTKFVPDPHNNWESLG